MKSLIPFVLLFGLYAGGCGDEAITSDPLPVADAGNVAIEKVVTPSSTEYTGEGKLVSREMKITRILSGYGVGAGEAIVSQKPMTVGESTTPATKITAAGVETSEGTQGKFVGASGGGTWTQMFLSKAKDWALTIGGIILLVVIGGTVLYFLVPAAKPIISGILRFFAALVPGVGSLVESAIAGVRVAAVQKPLEEVVAGGQTFKDLLDADATLTPEQRKRVKDLFTVAHQAEQDQSSQQAVKDIKATL
jgi:hypothetical protein